MTGRAGRDASHGYPDFDQVAGRPGTGAGSFHRRRSWWFEGSVICGQVDQRLLRERIHVDAHHGCITPSSLVVLELLEDRGEALAGQAGDCGVFADPADAMAVVAARRLS